MADEKKTTGINWEAMPVWPAKVASKYLDLRRSRMIKIAKGDVELPEGCPPLMAEEDGRKYYFDAQSVKDFKVYLDANPGALPTGGKRLPEGYARYRAYMTDAQAAELAEMYSHDENFRVIKAVKRKKKEKAEEAVEEATK